MNKDQLEKYLKEPLVFIVSNTKKDKPILRALEKAIESYAVIEINDGNPSQNQFSGTFLEWAELVPDKVIKCLISYSDNVLDYIDEIIRIMSFSSIICIETNKLITEKEVKKFTDTGANVKWNDHRIIAKY